MVLVNLPLTVGDYLVTERELSQLPSLISPNASLSTGQETDKKRYLICAQE
jgi:hypothetical protein